MSGSAEYGTCDICKKEANIERTYFRYDIKCECHYPSHFEIVYHCKNCIPKEPTITKIELKTENLSKRRIKLEFLKNKINF
jgi:hypothetical protein